MTSSGKLSSAIVDFVAPLRLWHGLRPPPMVGFVERESGGPASRSALRAFVGRSRENGKRSFRDVQAMFKRVRAPEEEKREKTRTRLVFSTVRFGRRPPAADRIRLSVWGGAPPMSMVFWGHAHSSSDI